MHPALDLLHRNRIGDPTDAAATRVFDVVGLGVSTVDLIMVVDEFPHDEVVQRAHSSLIQGGGPIATAMVALSKLGCRTAMVDKLGDDWRGKLILEEFLREGVATSYITVDKDHTSSIATVLVREHDGARTIVYSPGDAGELIPSELPEDLIAAGQILHLNGRHFQASMACALKAKQHGVLVSFDGGAYRFNEQLRELISLTDICIVARQFAHAYSGEEDLEKSASKLLDSGPKIVAITAGNEGSWTFDETGQSFHQPAFQLDSTVDTTGAGDAYHGAFLYGIVKKYSLRKCARFAGAVAAMSTRKFGGRAALPTFDETSRFLAEYVGA